MILKVNDNGTLKTFNVATKQYVDDEVGVKYEKPSGGIPASDMTTAVQTSLGLADSAYQKPSGGIPDTDLSSAVQASLGKADTALQSAPVTSVNTKTGAVTLDADDIGYDDTETYTTGTIGDTISTLSSDLNNKLDTPSTAGTSGQVLTSDGQGGQSWQTPSGGGSGGAVNSVNGKTGTVVLDAGDLAYDGTATYSSGTVGDELSDLKGEDKLLRSELPGTTQTVTFDSSGNPASITHSASGSTVRTDVFTWSSNSVTEVRTASNKQITITTNLTTLEQTISAITEVA